VLMRKHLDVGARRPVSGSAASVQETEGVRLQLGGSLLANTLDAAPRRCR